MRDVNTTETSDDWARFDAMTEEERHQAAMSDPDAIPMTEEELENAPIVPRVGTLRRALGATQEEFSRSQQHWYTIEKYHKIEEENPHSKFEYIDGQVRILAGETYEHVKIAINLLTILNIYLEDSVCEVVNSDIHILPTGRDNPSYFSDIAVTCNPEDYQPDSKAILSPILIIEVLSPSTELIDRTEKLRAY